MVDEEVFNERMTSDYGMINVSPMETASETHPRALGINNVCFHSTIPPDLSEPCIFHMSYNNSSISRYYAGIEKDVDVTPV